jgi:phenylacetate-CoA ligase
MIRDLIRKAHGSFIVLRNLPGQSRVQYLPLEKLHGLRDRRVRETVRYAAETVPFYRDWFREQGISPAEFRTADDLDRLPLVTKHLYREQPERFRSTSRLAQNAMSMTSGGSTGEPITVFHSHAAMLARGAYMQRQRAVMRKMLGGVRLPRELILAIPTGSSARSVKFRRESTFAYLRRHNRRVLWLGTPIDEVIAEINEFQPHSIGAYGSYVEALFRVVAQRGIDMHLPKMVAYGADTMSEDGMQLIREGFGVAVFSTYGSIEAPGIGFLCEECTGFHLNVDLVHVKLIDAEGRRLEPGERGEVVVSDLTNRATVLLNYRLSDLGMLLEQPCPCGRTLPLAKIEGRVEDILRLPDGGFLHPASVYNVFHEGRLRDGGQVLQFQVVQRAINDFEVRLAMADRAAYDAVASAYVADLQQVLGPSAKLEPVYYQGPVLAGPMGKVRRFVSLLEGGERVV